ncbi:hypothetical protein IAQ61_007218 [Plenodomus lingam]|nr:hypothetical protein IAQ61_007218 [Plenodomus lingam]
MPSRPTGYLLETIGSRRVTNGVTHLTKPMGQDVKQPFDLVESGWPAVPAPAYVRSEDVWSDSWRHR